MLRSAGIWTGFAAIVIAGTVYVAARMSAPMEHRAGQAARLIADYPAAAASVDSVRLRQVMEQLSGFSSRVAGYPGATAAADYIRGEFERLGFARADSSRFWMPGGAPRSLSESFSVVVPLDRGARIETPDSTGAPSSIPLFPLWPNLARTPTTPPGGLSGPLVYGGTGAPAELNGQDVTNSIAILDFNSGQNWLTLASLGARAIIFIEPDDTDRGEAEKKFLSVPADIPRFWVRKQDGIHLKRIAASTGQAVHGRIFAAMDWVSAPAQNLYAFLPGTDPDIAHEMIVIEAYYDAMSVAPALSPGAEQATGMAALLELVRFLKAHPLKRPVVFMASAGHGQALSGAVSFVNRHIRAPGSAMKVELFLALDLSSGSDRLGLMYKGHFYDQTQRYLQPWVSQIGRQATAIAEEAARARGLRPDALLVDGINPARGRAWQTYIPGQIALDSEPVMLAGRPGLALVTVEDARLLVDTPLDTPDRVHMDRVFRQTQTLVCVLPNLLNTSEPMVTKRLTDLWSTLSGRAVEFDVSANVLPDKPVPGAFVAAMGRMGTRTLMGVRAIPVTLADSVGRFEIDGLPTARGVGRERATVELSAYGIDPETGAIHHAPDRGEQGAGSFPVRIPMISAKREATVVLFRCTPMTLLDLVDQRYYEPLAQTIVYDAGTNGAPFIYGYAYPATGLFDPIRPVMTLFAMPGSRLRITMSSGLAGRQLLLLNATPDDPDGAGFRFGAEGEPSSSPMYLPYQAASDMWLLDESRLREFARHGIVNRQVDRLHASARAYLDQAREAISERRYDRYAAASKAAWSVESRAYPDILGTVEDAILGVLFYLALLIPFAYCVERLIFSTRRIEWRIAGIFGIFLAVFIALQAVHPAFSITFTPLIVLLAFVIMAMAATVIIIVVMKFEARMSTLRTAREGRHDDDMSRAGALATAAALGIANMRHRPFRTALTCITLTLLTFSVMSFTSVIRYLRLNEVEFGVDPPYQGLLLRHRTWEPLSEEAFTALTNEFSSSGPVAPRAWYYASRVGDQSYVDLRNPAADSLFVATALVGLSAAEQSLRPQLADCLVAGRWLTPSDAAGVLLPVGMARKLGIDNLIERQPVITIGGKAAPVLGIFDAGKLNRLMDLDNEPFTPVDFVQMSERRKQSGPPDPEEFEQYIHLRAENIAILPYPFVINLGGRLHSVAMGHENADRVTEALNALMPRTALTLFAGTGDRIVLYSTMGSTAVGGLADLAIPMMIAVLIVMNTMLGSVYERTKEIGVFNAVGLAPGHVGALFVAEAIVYGVVGVVLGYLSGQSVSALIIRSGWLPEFQLNVSSMAAVGASALVMLVALLSTIYPARLASRIAMPAADMGWRLPEAQDEHLALTLPFTVTGKDAFGLNMFLKEFMDAHAEVAAGEFSCEDVSLISPDGDRSTHIALSFVAWLKPYDLGVSQRVVLNTLATEDPGIFSLDVGIERVSGDHRSWLRLNRPFLNLLRKQFLLWRTLGYGGQTLYTDRFYHHVIR